MNDKDFEMLKSSIEEAGKIRKGICKPARVTKIETPEISEIREKLHMTQKRFAMMIGVSPRTLQNWEQGRRHPVGPAQALLCVAAKNPNAVKKALMA
ncbi:MAG: NadS family protein [Victivallaceae bacterium]